MLRTELPSYTLTKCMMHLTIYPQGASLPSYFHKTTLQRCINGQRRRFFQYGGRTWTHFQTIYCVRNQSQWAISQILGGYVPLSPEIAAHVKGHLWWVAKIKNVCHLLQFS